MKRFTRSVLAFFLSLTAILAIQSCKKSSGGSDSNSQYYMTATVSGKAWAANIANNSMHTPAIGGITTVNNVSVMLIEGLRAEGKDSSAFALIIPTNIALNKTVTFNAAQYTEGVYVFNTTGYNSTPQNKGSGSITITSFVDSSKTIEGTFSGVFGSTDGGSTTAQVSNGKFRCPYITITGNSNPFPPNVKF